jgi:hypothetical protein
MHCIASAAPALVVGALAVSYRAAESWLIAALPFDFWLRVKFAPRCSLDDAPRCTCYVLPHADDCGLLAGITQSGERVYWREPRG